VSRTLLPAVATTMIIVLSGTVADGAQLPAVKTTAQRVPPATAPHPPRQRSATARRSAPHHKNAKPPALSRVQVALQGAPDLAAAVTVRLPAGVDLMEVAAGFQNLDQFVAAVNASRTLGIPMRDLRRRMVADRMPLLLALQDLRPRSNYRADARRAEDEAAAMIRPTDAPALTLANRKS
jgi:hypothetical protein